MIIIIIGSRLKDTGCGTWQLDTTSATLGISQTEISCSEERKPLCLRKKVPASEITLELSSTKRRKNKGKGRRRNKKRQSLRWKQRKNKKSEKVGFTKKRQGRSASQAEARQTGQCDPIEVSLLDI